MERELVSHRISFFHRCWRRVSTSGSLKVPISSLSAGTHLVIPEEGIAAIGNVYTRRDHRGRGHAATLTSAVTNELLRMNLRTIVLNVDQRNETAMRVYQRLGYEQYCPYYEGLAKQPMGM